MASTAHSKSRRTKAKRATSSLSSSKKSNLRVVAPALSERPKKPLTWLSQLSPEQKGGVDAALTQEGFCLFCEQRTGKTWMTGAVVYHRAAQSVLITGLKSNLTSTWEKFITEKLPYYEIHYGWETFKQSKHPWRVLLVGYEGLVGIVDKTKKFDWDMVVFDECQRLKSRGSWSSRAARKMRKAKWRLGLSGTPMDDSPIDLFAIFRFIEPSLFGINWGPFKEQWTFPSGYMGKIPMFRKEMMGRFADIITPHIHRIEQRDMGMERAIIKWRAIELEPKQLSIYRRLERDMVVTVGGVKIKTPMSITQVSKLQQITGGWVFDDEHNVVHVGRAKERDLRKWLLSREGPLVIFCKFKPDVEICERVAHSMFDRVAVLTGAVKDRPKNMARTNMLLAFQRGEFDVIICQQKTGGAGVDLYLAREAYVYSCGHSFIDFDQMSSRLTFLKQSGPAKFTVPYAPETVDQDIRLAVNEKRSVTDVVWERLSRRKLHGKGSSKEAGSRRIAGRESRGG